ncbi:MAG: NADPH-adrenodoxin reductase [Cirrosporium novae-zelandiae]|nr:MAG: NADPH-adrenodoxin reductase [Cirrosporium novae-zelandiae]
MKSILNARNVCVSYQSSLALSWRPRHLIHIKQTHRSFNGNSNVTTKTKPFRIAIIGSGPAGFYVASKVLSKLDDAVIDMYEHLPTPFGLVRYGVAPDHPEVKNCQDRFTEVASSSRFNFIGNINIGSDLPLTALKPHYDAILFAYGASEDKKLDLPGEDTLKGIYSARAFVGWYNGLSEYSQLAPDLSGENAIIIGQGNVALDVARILLTDINTLKKTDITEHALEVLSKNKIKRVRVVGRRGTMQAAFTIKEVRELLHLPSVYFHPIPKDLFPPNIPKGMRQKDRIVKLLQSGSQSFAESLKSWSLDFLLTPMEFRPTKLDKSHIGQIDFQRNLLQSNDPFPVAVPASPSVHAKVIPTGEGVSFPADAVFRSVGYKSVPLLGLEKLDIPFDKHVGTFPNDGSGRVLHSSQNGSGLAAIHVPGIYCAGWVKRGPTGVIASTMEDAFETASVIVTDWKSKVMFLNGPGSSEELGSTGLGWEGVRSEAERKGLKRVSWEDWQKIDEAERKRGAAKGKPREKFPSVKDMLEILG